MYREFKKYLTDVNFKKILSLLTVPRVSKLLLIYEPSFLRNPVVSVLELSDPARSIRFCKRIECDIKN